MKFDLLIESILNSITKDTLGPFVVSNTRTGYVVVDRYDDTPLVLKLSPSLSSTDFDIGAPYYFEVKLGEVVKAWKKED